MALQEIALPVDRRNAASSIIDSAARAGRHRRPQEAGPDVHRHGLDLPGRRGLMAVAIRLQLVVPEQRLRLAGCLQSILHHARHLDGLSGRHADHRRADELSRAADDRRARHGFPAPERLRLLDVSLRWRCFSISVIWARRAWRARLCAGRRLVRLRAAHRPRLLARAQHGLLDSQPAAHGIGSTVSAHQRHRDRRSACAAEG